MRAADAPWQLQPASAHARLWLFLPCVALPVAASLVLLVVGGERMRPALYAAMAVLGVTLALWLLLDRLMRRHRLQVDAGGLEVVTALYRRRLAWSELQLDAARVIAIDEHPERKPLFKTNAMSVFGFNGGWFRSRALEKLFVATTGGERLLWLPTTRGYTLLLQPRRPQALLDRLQELAPRPPRR